MRSSRTRRPPKTSAAKPRFIKIILVKWEDATHIDQEGDGAAVGTMLVWTAGVEVHRNKKEVALCMEIFEDGQKRNISTIPRGMIKSVLTLAKFPITVGV